MLAQLCRGFHFRQFSYHLPHHEAVVAFWKKCRRGCNRVGVGSEGFEQETETLEHFELLFQEHHLPGGELNRLRYQEALCFHLPVFHLAAQFFESDSLMGSMLVNEHQSSGPRTNQVAAENLSQNVKRGKEPRLR